ncbi:MAG TPA: tRNA uridine-5-carboxymethylaminomethyl(34) synthesis GTPase MnmE [Leptospiraceae bacterium]|nr:tRNA uridine-5-carboxymethylaminomethyl(34) synthesis GTPase MnmE [Leptospiraceae bacterium]HMW08211.1 tRNA uridine-5-carboxymethylaminomethyl(34) synthesis GTPase MnmE [Leptospiraceae bacterium]HMX34408.1 tRNA uridine-5-carboxymethylaminomethyl(34) synthesis GTPase MnmE [Leptospiraceae bacterium]HMZ64623.1 tRNA uridine-5-carboxymethylaminomethyl(34) synthesis GTPase MnmE [Leptospiraceae bacterium]HNA09101.1 tRNA uridine-5-carboxymethylaminomethyl(34) synthesis GTPase MnmE [Leptospiraceae ba
MIDTIAAISSGNIPSAIGIIRLSGENVLSICSKVLSGKDGLLTSDFIQQNPRKAIYCDFVEDDIHIDQIVFIFFKNPNSYTGEDLAEFYFHGNPILLKNALQILFKKGARPAKEGEFTKRAFLNGKLDLTGAEAIGRLINARSKFELELAQKNVFGEIHRLSSRVRSDLISLKAECEAEIDFSTEDLTYESFEQRKERIHSLYKLCTKVLDSSKRAESFIEHNKIVIYGEPNTGKSSLLNSLIGKERAIVSSIPGTTRDYLAENFSLNGIPLQLVDTAGIRETEDSIEKMGIQKSHTEFESANLRLFILDISKPILFDELIERYEHKIRNSILVANKLDIAHESWVKNKELFRSANIEACEVSCKTKQGIDELLNSIHSRLIQIDKSDDYVLLEERNEFYFRKIQEHLKNAIDLMESAPAEIYIKEIDYALENVGYINGKIDTEEILGRIFSKFCVGK